MFLPRRNDATRRSLGFALLLAGIVLSRPAEAGDPLRLLICQPGGPALGDEQQQVISKMYRYVERKTGLGEGQIQGFYTNERDKCLAELEQKPAIVLPSLPIYFEHKEKYGLTPVAQLRLDGKTEDHYYLMVKAKSPIASAKDLAGKTVTGTHLGSASFLTDIVLEGKLKPDEVKVQPQRLSLRAIREVTTGKSDAVLLDGTQYRALKGTQYESQLQLLHTSRALPTPPVTVMKGRVPKGFGQKLGRALNGMTEDPEGQEVIRIFRIDGFAPAVPDVWASLEKQIKSAP
jgi:ABC-type phosphate/phosphonate transport system substrate-binding protein